MSNWIPHPPPPFSKSEELNDKQLLARSKKTLLKMIRSCEKNIRNMKNCSNCEFEITNGIPLSHENCLSCEKESNWKIWKIGENQND